MANCFATIRNECSYLRVTKINAITINEAISILEETISLEKEVLLIWEWLDRDSWGHGWCIRCDHQQRVLIHSFENKFNKITRELTRQDIYTFIKIIRRWFEMDKNNAASLLLYPLLQWLQVEKVWIPINAQKLKVYICERPPPPPAPSPQLCHKQRKRTINKSFISIFFMPILVVICFSVRVKRTRLST